MAGPERRSHDREQVNYPVRIVTASGDEFDGVVDNLGALGALVATPNVEASFEVGEGQKLTLRIDTGQGVVEADGTVLRLEQEFAAGEIRLSFAVKFARPLELPNPAG
jgi:hypothetical protein